MPDVNDALRSYFGKIQSSSYYDLTRERRAAQYDRSLLDSVDAGEYMLLRSQQSVEQSCRAACRGLVLYRDRRHLLQLEFCGDGARHGAHFCRMELG